MPYFTKVNKRTHKRNGTLRVFSIFLFIICLGSCVFLADIFSNVITVGSFGFSQGATRTPEYSIYAISLSKFSTKSLAEDYAEDIKKQNAAGFVWKIDSFYHVFASAYEKENDATLVKDNLKTSGHESEIIEIKFKSAEFQIEDKVQLGIFVDSVKTFKNIYLSLYDVSVSLDTDVYTDSKARIIISELETNTNNTLDKLKVSITSENSLLYIMLKVRLSNIKNLLSDLVNISNSAHLSTKIKYAYFEVLKSNHEFLAECQ